MAIRCRQCGGKGVEECPKCHGKGTITAYRPINPEASWQETCPKCNGEGKTKCRNSPPCDGGWIR